MKSIVTGGAGFIGSHVANNLLNMGHKVLVIDNLSGGSIDNIPTKADFELKSINDDLENIFLSYKPNIVYHLAAYAAEGLSHHIPKFNYENNIIGTINILNASYKAKATHFIFTSSIAVYGHPYDNKYFTESDRCLPCDPYGIAKLACEFHIKSFVNYYKGIRYTIFRPHNVYGIHQNISDPYRNVIGIFMNRAINGLPLPIFGDGSQTRSFSYIDLVANCIVSAAFTEKAINQTFNIGEDNVLSIRELAELISTILGVPLNIEWLPPRKEVDHAHCMHEKAKAVFADMFQSSVSVKSGLSIMAEYIKRKAIPPTSECPSLIEINDNLPKSWADRLKLMS